MWDYTVKVEEARAAGNGKPSAGAVYRSIYAKNELLETPSHMDSPWDFFSKSVKKNSNNQMLGHRQIKNGKAGGYSRLTYQQVYDATLKIGSAIRRRGVNPCYGKESGEERIEEIREKLQICPYFIFRPLYRYTWAWG